MELTEELAALKVFERQARERIADIEAQIKYGMLEEYSENPDSYSSQKQIRIGGYEVGKYSLVTPKNTVQIKPGHEDEAINLLSSLGLTELKPVRHWEDVFSVMNGEVVHIPTGTLCDCLDCAPSGAAFVRSSGFKTEKVKEAFKATGIAANQVIGLLEG